METAHNPHDPTRCLQVEESDGEYFQCCRSVMHAPRPCVFTDAETAPRLRADFREGKLK